MSQVNQDMAAAVGDIVRRFKRIRKYGSRFQRTDEDDLRQEGWLHALKVREKFRPEACKTGSIKPLIRLVVLRNVRRLVLSNAAPVSLSDHDRYIARELKSKSDEVLVSHVADLDQERELEIERLRARVTVRLRELEGDQMADTLLDAEGAVKTKLGVKALERLSNDEELRQLWKLSR